MKDQQKFIDQLRNSRDPETATKGCGYFIIWADGRGIVAYKHKQDAIDFIDQDSDDPYGMDVLQVTYREAEKGERVRNKFTEASAKTYKTMKKAFDEEVTLDDNGYGYTNKLTYLPEEYLGFTEALPENIAEGYDFGGVEGPFYKGLTIVDLDAEILDESHMATFKEESFIKGDLTTPLNLEPRPFINVSDVFSNLGGPSEVLQVADNIDRALLPGGKVRLLDSIDILLPALNYLKTLGYEKIWDYNYEGAEGIDGFIDEDDDDAFRYDIILQKPQIIIEGNKLNFCKKAWDNPPRDEDHYPGSNTGSGGGIPYSTPKSPGSKPRRDQRTTEDYHTPSELERDQIPGDTPPEQGTGGQSHSGEPGDPDNIYPEPSNWLRPLKGLPFTDEHINHDFNEDFESEYNIRQRGLNMRRVKKSGLSMKKAQQPPEWANPKFLGGALYAHVKDVLKTYAKQIREDPQLEDQFITETIPALITRDKDLYISAGVTLPIMLEAIKEAANLFMVQDKIALDTLHSEQAAMHYYPEGPRQQTSEMSTMEMGEARLLEELTVDQIWDIARNPETENTPEGQAARGLIEKGIVASKLNMKKQSNDFLDEVDRVVAQWQLTAEAAGVDDEAAHEKRPI